MKFWIGCDHAALEAKEALKSWLESSGHKIEDVGTHSLESCHYPEFAIAVARGIQSEPNSLGLLLCGSGIGVSIVANRFKGVRAALVHTSAAAELARAHNDANVLCFGARQVSIDQMKEMVSAFLARQYEGGRHDLRLNLFAELGEKA